MELSQGVLFRHWDDTSEATSQQLLVVPQSLVPLVIQSLHNGVGGGHLGLTKPLAKVKDRFFWPEMRSDVEDWCQQCSSCASQKSPSQTPQAPLVPTYVGYPMEHIALDLLGPLPTTRHGNKHIAVVCDYLHVGQKLMLSQTKRQLPWQEFWLMSEFVALEFLMSFTVQILRVTSSLKLVNYLV